MVIEMGFTLAQGNSIHIKLAPGSRKGLKDFK